MKNIIKYTVSLSLFLLPTSLFAWKWIDLWQTPDQQGAALLQAGKAKEASQVFKNKDWRGVASYRSGHYSEAYRQFSGLKTSDAAYNAGNAAAFMGRYEDAIHAYDKALALNANNTDAMTNREIIKKLMEKKKQQQQQNNSSANNDKNNNSNKKNTANNQSNSSNENKKEDSSSQNKDKKQNAQNNKPKETNSSSQQQSQQQSNNKDQTPNGQKSNSKQQNEQTSISSPLQAQDENKKQLLRRLADDPGGLLRQKFLRDYLRRHEVMETNDQGEN